MKLKLIKKNLIYLCAGIFVLGLVVAFGRFDYVSSRYVHPEPITPEGAFTSFNFTPTRANVSGVMIKFIKNLYAYQILDRTMAVKIKYKDNQGENREIIKDIPLSQIQNGNQRLSFPTLRDVKGQQIQVIFSIKGEPLPAGSFTLSNQDYNPNSDINTSPRVIYRQWVRDLLAEFWHSFVDRDAKFTYFYFTVITLLILSSVTLLLFRKE